MQHFEILERLEQIELDLAAMDPLIAGKATKAKRDFELAYSRAFIKAEGAEGLRKATAIDVCARSGHYSWLKTYEAAEVSAKRAIDLLQTRSMILLGELKSATRETGPIPMPAWTPKVDDF